MKAPRFFLIIVAGVITMTMATGAWAQWSPTSNQGGPDSYLSGFVTPNAAGIKIGGTVTVDFVFTGLTGTCKSVEYTEPIFREYTANYVLRILMNNKIYPFAFSRPNTCETDLDYLMAEFNGFINTTVLGKLYPGVTWVNSPPAVLKWTGNYQDIILCTDCSGHVGFVMFDFQFAVK